MMTPEENNRITMLETTVSALFRFHCLELRALADGQAALILVAQFVLEVKNTHEQLFQLFASGQINDEQRKKISTFLKQSDFQFDQNISTVRNVADSLNKAIAAFNAVQEKLPPNMRVELKPLPLIIPPPDFPGGTGESAAPPS